MNKNNIEILHALGKELRVMNLEQGRADIKTFKDKGIPPKKCLSFMKRKIAKAASQAFRDLDIDYMEPFLREEAKEFASAIKKEIEIIYGVKFKKKEVKNDKIKT